MRARERSPDKRDDNATLSTCDAASCPGAAESAPWMAHGPDSGHGWPDGAGAAAPGQVGASSEDDHPHAPLLRLRLPLRLRLRLRCSFLLLPPSAPPSIQRLARRPTQLRGEFG